MKKTVTSAKDATPILCVPKEMCKPHLLQNIESSFVCYSRYSISWSFLISESLQSDPCLDACLSGGQKIFLPFKLASGSVCLKLFCCIRIHTQHTVILLICVGGTDDGAYESAPVYAFLM